MPCHELEDASWLAYEEAQDENEAAWAADGEQFLWDQHRDYHRYVFPMLESDEDPAF